MAVVVRIDLIKERVELRVRHDQAGLPECGSDFVLVQRTVVVAIDAVEKGQKLTFRMFDERLEFFKHTLASVS